MGSNKMYLPAWEWLQKFWTLVACFWLSRKVEFSSIVMPNGFNSQSVKGKHHAKRVFFSVSQAGAVDDQVNVAMVTAVDDDTVVIVCDSQTASCKIDWVAIG